MAIIIPSKHIYSIEDNSKLLKNKIDRIDYSQKIVNTKIEETNVYNISMRNVDFYNGDNKSNSENNTVENISFWGVALAYVEQTPIYLHVSIMVNNDYGDIINLSTMKVMVIVDKYRQEISKEVSITYNKKDKQVTIDVLNTNLSAQTLIDKDIVFTKDLKSISRTEHLSAVYNTLEVTSTAEIESSPNDEYFDLEISLTDDNNYIIDCILYVGIINSSLGNTAYSILDNIKLPNLILNGEQIEYRPTRIDLSFSGQKISVEVKEENLIIGNGKFLYNYEDSNELMQSTNNPTLNAKLEKIIDKWKDGRERAVLECGIADYYDENGNRIKDMNSGDTFKLHEQVIPYIYQGLGLPELPISTKKNGEPKVFEIIGREISYEGVPLQKITILEV